MKRLDETGQLLASEALGRARSIAGRYARLFNRDAEDLESSACWGAVRAAASFEPDGGQIWERWSKMAIVGEIKDSLDSAYHKNRPRQEGPFDLARMVAVEDDPPPEESAEEVERILALLPPRFKEICSLVYKDGLSPYSAGQAIGLSGSQGCRIHQQAIAFLRGTLVA